MAAREVNIELRWSDMDAYQHVNNVAMLRLVEEARIRLLTDLDVGLADHRVTMFVAHQEIDYLTPLKYSHDPAVIRIGVSRLGRAGFDLGYQVVGADGSVSALVETTMVVVDSTGRPTGIPDELRAALSAVSDEPVPLRRRRDSTSDKA